MSVFLSKMFDVGDLPVLTFGNWVLKAEWLSGLWNYMYVFYVFYVFSKSKKHDFLRFFEFLHTFSRTVGVWRGRDFWSCFEQWYLMIQVTRRSFWCSTPGLILMKILDCTDGDIFGERGARGYNAGLGQSPQRGPGAETLVRGSKPPPLKLTAF